MKRSLQYLDYRRVPVARSRGRRAGNSPRERAVCGGKSGHRRQTRKDAGVHQADVSCTKNSKEGTVLDQWAMLYRAQFAPKIQCERDWSVIQWEIQSAASAGQIPALTSHGSLCESGWLVCREMRGPIDPRLSHFEGEGPRWQQCL